ncbi:MAG: LacI family transcriptional regulator, partial [Victivallales bacterium]|nr:LacI family transcriptional regulator [Victivallales bacterium]
INAKRLFSKKSNVIGLVMPSYERNKKHALTDHHLAGIFSGIEEGLNDSNYRLLMIFNDRRFETQKEYLSLFSEKSIDGMIVWGQYREQTFGSEISQKGYPALFISPPYYDMQLCNYVIHDYENSGKLAFKYLLDRGFQKILWAGANQSSAICKLMENGFAKVAPKFDFITEYGDFSRECGRKIGLNAIQKHPEITAILAANADVGLGLHDVYGNAGPEIVVCDSATEDEEINCNRICVDDLALGKQSVRQLLNIIEAKKDVIREILPVKLLLKKDVRK